MPREEQAIIHLFNMAIASASHHEPLSPKLQMDLNTIDKPPSSNTPPPPPTTERVDRTSFSSIKESHTTGIAQTFTDSRTSSILKRSDNEAIVDDFSERESTTPREGGKRDKGMLTNPHSVLHGLVCPCDGFKGWKGIAIGGKVASKSYGDLKSLGMRWDWEAPSTVEKKGDEKVKEVVEETEEVEQVERVEGMYAAGQSPLERLPMELLGSIIDQLATDIPPNGFTARNIDLMSLLLTSHALHAATLTTLYSQITIPHSRIFAKFLAQMKEYKSLGTIVRRLDFSHFNPTGAGMTARERAQTQNLIPETLSECLKLTPNLREFLAQEHIDEDLDARVIQALFCDLPKLTAIDFCACSTTDFRDNFNAVINASPSPIPDSLSITRMSLHECTILPSSIYESLLPKLVHLTHLDVSHTRITDAALHSIPQTARLTHLNLSKCSHLTGPSVVDFLSNHTAVKSLIYLNLAMDIKSHELFTSDNLTDLLPSLPSTLKSLSLKGSAMNETHIPLLLPLTKHLEELGLGFNLDLSSITSLLFPDEKNSLEEQMNWIPHNLRYIDASDLSPAQLDLGTLFGMSCPVLKNVSEPLEVIEVGPEVHKRVAGASGVLKRVGWCLQEAGRRGWLVRVRSAATGSEVTKKDDGSRKWKMGATYWGMRKIPVGRAEVGGMYGHYMFKR